MSAPLAGKFADHYEILGVDAKADLATIKDAYTKLAAKFNPNSPAGNREKFQELNASYEVLSDPHLRKAFDSVRGGNEEAPIQFPVGEFLADLEADANRRICLLSLLYYRRKMESISPGISQRQVESVMKVDAEQLSFITWVLKQQGLAMSDDKSRLLITVAGIEFIEKLKPQERQITPWLRNSVESVVEAPADVVPEKPVEAQPVKPQATGSGLATEGLSSLRSALQKSIGLSMGSKPVPAAKDKEKAAPAKAATK